MRSASGNVSSPLVLRAARIDRDLARLEVLADLVEIPLVDVELGGQELGRRLEARRQQLLPLLLQPEEQLPPRARVADVDEARVRHQELQHVGADPVGGVRPEARPERRLPPLDRLHEPDAPLLEQVEDARPGAAVLVGDRDDQPQVVNDQPARGVHVPLLADRLAQLSLLLVGETREAPRLGQEPPDRIAQRRQRAGRGRRHHLVHVERVGGLSRRQPVQPRRRRRGPPPLPGGRRPPARSLPSSALGRALLTCVVSGGRAGMEIISPLRSGFVGLASKARARLRLGRAGRRAGWMPQRPGGVTDGWAGCLRASGRGCRAARRAARPAARPPLLVEPAGEVRPLQLCGATARRSGAAGHRDGAGPRRGRRDAGRRRRRSVPARGDHGRDRTAGQPAGGRDRERRNRRLHAGRGRSGDRRPAAEEGDGGVQAPRRFGQPLRPGRPASVRRRSPDRRRPGPASASSA